MIASLRVCIIDWMPVNESKEFQRILRLSGVRTAVKATTRIWIDFDKIQQHGSDELNQVVDLIGYVPPNERSEAS